MAPELQGASASGGAIEQQHSESSVCCLSISDHRAYDRFVAAEIADATGRYR